MAVINGSINRDIIDGTAGDDQINGLAGNDEIRSGSGNDTLNGNEGNDVLRAGFGSDILIGGDGDDSLVGWDTSLSSRLTAATPDGNDVLIGGPGNNILWGGSDDVGSVFTGNDTFYLGTGNNAVAGGDGVDTVIYDLPRRSYTLTPGLLGFPTATSRQFDGLLVSKAGALDRIIEVENLQFLDGRIVRDLNDPIAQVVRLYKAALDRAPEPGGLNFWADRITSGVPINQLAGAIASSTEFQTRFSAGDSAGYVQQLYRNALGREADTAGLNFWVGRLNGGTTRGDVLVAFAESDENKANTAALIQSGIYDQNEGIAKVARLYDTAFNRLPDLAGLIGWRDAIFNGATIEQIAQGFTAAQEFTNIYGGPGTAAGTLIDSLYVNTLNRPADAAGRAFWVQQIESGAATRAQVVLGFSESQEHVANTTLDIEGGVRFT